MPRGQPAQDGDTRTSQNGYMYVKTPQGKWELAHKIVAEVEVLGRELEPDERVRFKDGDRTNLNADNLLIVKVRPKVSVEKRKAYLMAKIEELQAQLEELE